jgi:tetratricopeptide (TPR) repeat protein
MTFPDEESERERAEQTKLAVSLAMEGKWREAVEVNQSLLKKFPMDVETYNRLGRALIELGDYAGAREAYSFALDISPHNGIAKRNLERLAHLGDHPQTPHSSKGDGHKFAPQIFVKESGKAGIVKMEALASATVISGLTAGEEVSLRIVDEQLLAYNSDDEYLGRAEVKHEARLIKLMEGGNQYAAAVSKLGEGELDLIVKETHRDPSLEGHPSFPPEEVKEFRSGVRKSMVRYEVDDSDLDVPDDEYRDQTDDSMEDLGFHEVSAGG